MTFHRSKCWMLALSLVLTGAAAHADVTIESALTTDGVGLMSAVGMTGHTSRAISGERSRSDSEIKFNSKMVSFFARRATGPHAQIVRLDQDKVYELDLNNKQYTEMTFEQQKARLAAISANANDKQAAAQQPKPFDESQCDWSPPKSKVAKGGKATIAGFESEQYTITASQTCTDRKTQQSCDIALILDQWLTPKVPGTDEQLKFYRAYAQKLGGTAEGSREVMERAQNLFSRYDSIWKGVAEKMKDVKGVPLRVSFSFAIGGASCQSAQQQTQAGGGLPPSSPTASEIGSEIASAAVEQKTAEKTGGAFGGIAGKLAGSLFNHKKKAEEEDAAAQHAPGSTSAAAPAAAVAAPGALIDILRVTSQVTSIKTDPIAPGAFEVPPGFKKVDSK